MAQHKKDGVFINCYIQKDINEELDRQSKKTRKTKTAIIEDALMSYFEKEKTQRN